MRHDVDMLFKRKGDDAPNPNVPIEDVPGYHPASPVQSPFGGQQISLSPHAEAEIRLLIGQNKKIQAIKVMREQTGLGLKDAKDLVEAIAAGHSIAPAMTGYPEPPQTSAVTGYPEPPQASLSDQVRAFEDAGDHASAVALVRARTGMSDPEAEAFITALTPDPFA